MLAISICTALAAIIEAFYDAKNILKGKTIEHNFSALMRVLGVFLMCLIALQGSILYIVLLTVIQLTVFWIVFDIAINLFRFRDIKMALYIGKTSKVDKFFGSISSISGGWRYLLMKITLLLTLLAVWYS